MVPPLHIEAIADGKQAAININNYLKAPTGINRVQEIELPPQRGIWLEQGAGQQNAKPAPGRALKK